MLGLTTQMPGSRTKRAREGSWPTQFAVAFRVKKKGAGLLSFEMRWRERDGQQSDTGEKHATPLNEVRSKTIRKNQDGLRIPLPDRPPRVKYR